MASRANRRVHVIGAGLLRGGGVSRPSCTGELPGRGHERYAGEHLALRLGVQTQISLRVIVIGGSLSAYEEENKNRASCYRVGQSAWDDSKSARACCFLNQHPLRNWRMGLVHEGHQEKEPE